MDNSTTNQPLIYDSFELPVCDYIPEFALVCKLSDSKLPVFLAQSESGEKCYAAKLFPFSQEEISINFLNEIQFSKIKHPNLIVPLYWEYQRKCDSGSKSFSASLTLMEYASNGDFHHALIDNEIPSDEKLTRTYFWQLVDALDYLHQNGMAHMDIKLENVLLGQKYQLKLIDFDLSYSKHVDKVRGRGTPDYRAPELKEKKEGLDVYKCDVFSAGIFLFTLQSRGILPFKEGAKTNRLYQDFDLSPKLFWSNHQRIQKQSKEFWSPEFKELFESMCHSNPKKRPTMEQIKNFSWMKGPRYTQDELNNIMETVFGNDE